jgi:hypothetical protein
VDRFAIFSPKIVISDKLAPSFRDGKAGPGIQSGKSGFESQRAEWPTFMHELPASALWIPGSAPAFGGTTRPQKDGASLSRMTALLWIEIVFGDLQHWF